MEITINIPEYIKGVCVIKQQNGLIKVSAANYNYHESFFSFDEGLLGEGKDIVNEGIHEMFETLNPNEKAK